MAENRPNVFSGNNEKRPSNQQPNQLTNEQNEQKIQVDSEYEKERVDLANNIYESTYNQVGWDAVAEMKKRTEEQMRLRDEALRKNAEYTSNYQNQYDYAKNRELNQPKQEQPQQQTVNYTPKQEQPIVNNKPIEAKKENYNFDQNLKMEKTDSYINEISQPQFNTSYDLIPMPSEGKLYKNKKANFKVSYLTTADENILTSPNLLQSGEFLEILINRKLLEQDIRYKDLHIGDRNAIMLWLRATSYGEMYPVTLIDDTTNQPFDTEINLNDLKFKNLGAEPDAEGYFDFYLTQSKANIKFKLLTVGDVEEIEELNAKDKENNLPVNNVTTYTLERQIVEVNGVRDRNYIREFVQNIRISDSKKLKEYINQIDCGVDLEIEVSTPGGGTMKTFLPLNVSFFWPDFNL
jgi:hypothetical protein